MLDTSGRYVIPGGVDAHPHGDAVRRHRRLRHFRDRHPRGRPRRHHHDHRLRDPAAGERVQDTLAAWHTKAAGNCAIDYGFHQILGGVDSDALKAMDELVAEGVTSFKLFMAYPGVYYSDDGQILRAMQQCASNGALTMMHAENGIAIDQLVAQHIERGETSPYYHGVSRPWELEEEATHRAIMLAKVTGAPLYVVHVSAKQAVEQIATAQGRGANVFAETCPQYLYLSLEEQLGAAGFEGAKWVCSTPLRSREDRHQDELWRYIRTGDVATVSTDHCPFCFKGRRRWASTTSPDPQRDGRRGASHRPDVPGRGQRQPEPAAVGRRVTTTPARMFEALPARGHHLSRGRRRRRDL